MYKYPVIIFEGIEASGKSTNVENVSKFLNKINRRFVKIREPGGSKNSEKIRKLILDKNSTFNKKTDLLLLLASRSENIEKILKKKLQKKNYFDRPIYRFNNSISTLWNEAKT